jgi:hypothetical protein
MASRVILGVNDERADAGDLGSLNGAQEGVAHESSANALSLPVLVHGEARQ